MVCGRDLHPSQIQCFTAQFLSLHERGFYEGIFFLITDLGLVHQFFIEISQQTIYRQSKLFAKATESQPDQSK